MTTFTNFLSSVLMTFGLEGIGLQDRHTPRISVTPMVETASVRVEGDAADDAVVWLNPTDSALSLVLATNKKQGLEVYDLEGKRTQSLAIGKLNNVDLRWFERPGEAPVAVVTATDRTERAIAVFAVDNLSRQVTLTGRIPLDMQRPYGLCMYDNGTELFVFVNDKSGRYQQWQIRQDLVSGELVREFNVGSTPEGCAVDDVTGTLYFGIEDLGLYAIDAGADADTDRETVDEVGLGRLEADVEGVAIYRGEKHQLLIASSQGSDTYVAYELQPPWNPVAVISIVDGAIDGTSKSDGVAINAARMGSFAKGIWVVQDDNNTRPRSNQNFKYVDIESVLDKIQMATIALAQNRASESVIN